MLSILLLQAASSPLPRVAPTTPPKPAASRLAAGKTARWDNPWFRWSVLGVAALLLIAGVGASVFYAWRPAGSHQVAIYMTDAPTGFDRFDVKISGVYVGAAGYPLALKASQFDVLQYRGTENSLKVAEGRVPAGEYKQVSIVFVKATAYTGGQALDLPIPLKMLKITSGFELGARQSSALFDLDIGKSIVTTPTGLAFRPFIQNVWSQDSQPGTEASNPAMPDLSRNGFTNPPVEEPQQRAVAPPAHQAPPQTSSSSPDGYEAPPPTTPTTSSAGPSIPRLVGQGTEFGDLYDGCGEAAVGAMDDELTVARKLAESHFCSIYIILTDERDPTNRPVPAEADAVFDIVGYTTTVNPLASGLPVNPGGVVGDVERLANSNGQSAAGGNAIMNNQMVLRPNLLAAMTDVSVSGGTVLGVFNYLDGFVASLPPALAWSYANDESGQELTIYPAGQELALFNTADAYANLQGLALQQALLPQGVLNHADLPLTGAGVGVGIVDTGVDGLHRDLGFDVTGLRDLVYRDAAVYENLMFPSLGAAATSLNDDARAFPPGTVDENQVFRSLGGPGVGRTPSTDYSLKGHGTMVAGLIVGQPSPYDATDGANRQHGVAPGSKLNACSFGPATPNLLAATWCLDQLVSLQRNPREGDPPMLVVSLSWGIMENDPTYPGSPIARLIGKLVEGDPSNGIPGATVVIAAGYAGVFQDPGTAYTSYMCRTPIEGVVCVGGSKVASSLSRIERDPNSPHGQAVIPAGGQAAWPGMRETWPDVCAPSTDLRSTVPLHWGIGAYIVAPGGATSFAAPQVAGVIALGQEARLAYNLGPLSPERVEQALEESANRLPALGSQLEGFEDSYFPAAEAADGDFRYHMASEVCGHGLVDAKAFVALVTLDPRYA